jgi:negative regulator of flagellin synthesis FlgM
MNVNDGLRNVQPLAGMSETSPVSPVQQTHSVSHSANEGTTQDHTEVSIAAKLATRAMSAPDVRMDKVAALQQALANGKYAVSADDVANKIVNHMLGE